MYYLAKFCRICIQTGGRLLDIESTDHDSIKFSEKLKLCTDMVITRESLSTHICTSCVQKLRISYQFQTMCKRSTSVLQRYLTELLSGSNKISAEKFVNSDLRVTLTAKLPKARRKRVGKDERCSLLKKLLSKITEEQMVQNIHINGLAKLCDMLPPPPPLRYFRRDHEGQKSPREKPEPGGLKSLIRFTKHYDFGYDISNVTQLDQSFDLSPLEKLNKFTDTYFYDHFGDYRDVIVHARDNINFDSDDDEMFEGNEKHSFETVFLSPNPKVKQEIVIVEPDIRIKRELEFDYADELNMDQDHFSHTLLDQGHHSGTSSNYTFKQESSSCSGNFNFNFQHSYHNRVPCMSENNQLKETTQSSKFFNRKIGNTLGNECSVFKQNGIVLNNVEGHKECDISIPTSSSLEQMPSTSTSSLIGQLRVVSLDLLKKDKSLPPNNIRCRTRGNPFINPQLKKQFQFRSFKCDVCNRRFKSLGYLKAHRSKVKH